MSCGGCRGLGAHSPRCITQPGFGWRKIADAAEELGDMIGSSDCEMANQCYSMAARASKRWREAVEKSANQHHPDCRCDPCLENEKAAP